MNNEIFIAKPEPVMTADETRIWELIKKYPEELSFILQEKDYEAYVDTFSMSDPIPLTEEEFYLIKNFFHDLISNSLLKE